MKISNAANVATPIVLLGPMATYADAVDAAEYYHSPAARVVEAQEWLDAPNVNTTTAYPLLLVLGKNDWLQTMRVGDVLQAMHLAGVSQTL